MAGTRTRLSLVEYGQPIDLCSEVSKATGLDRLHAEQLLLNSGARVARSLGFSSNPIVVDAKGVRATDFAGLIRLGPSLELEIAPKFLGLDDDDSRWREDFFFLSTLSKHGCLLAGEKISSSGGAPRDLATLVAKSLVEMYESLKRRPIRTYRRAKENDFFLDGDPDPTDLVFPNPDGFEQNVTLYDRRNSWNATISTAANELIPEVSDPTALAGLVRIIEDLSPQKYTNIQSRKPIPSRHRIWQPLHNLSRDILNGLGINYRNGNMRAPGFIVPTWQIWEDLLTIGARLGFGRAVVSPQQGFILGTRHKYSTGERSAPLHVYPDCVIHSGENHPQFLLDAKYKNRIDRSASRINEADIYEALAFSRASQCQRIILAYPALPSAGLNNPGDCSIFESIDINGVHVFGIQIEARGISQTGGLTLFSSNLAKFFTNIFC